MFYFCEKSDVLENVAIQVAIRNLLGLRLIDMILSARPLLFSYSVPDLPVRGEVTLNREINPSD
jgi:hypothetical protein